MSGSITVNGAERNLSHFRKQSCYIMQDNQLHANLTVQEAMRMAASLKLSKDYPDKPGIVSKPKHFFVPFANNCVHSGV
jgi:ABC-type multidrug transport system ATPase subunit